MSTDISLDLIDNQNDFVLEADISKDENSAAKTAEETKIDKLVDTDNTNDTKTVTDVKGKEKLEESLRTDYTNDVNNPKSEKLTKNKDESCMQTPRDKKTRPKPLSKKVKFNLDLVIKNSSSSETQDRQCEIKTDLVISLEKFDSKNISKEVNFADNDLDKTPIKDASDIKTEKSPNIEKNKTESESNSIKSPTVADKSPTQEKISDIEKIGSNQKEGSLKEAKDGSQVKQRTRVNKRKLEQEQDKKLFGNSPPYFKFDDDSPISDSLPLDQVLGSVISTNVSDDSRSAQVRTSARVIKKMRLEAVAPSTSKIEVTDKKEKKEEPKLEAKQKAPWTHEEKIMFFEAVSEFGKDFHNIFLVIHSKLKKSGVPDDQNRTKEHVRQFYYKTFHEVCRHVKFSDKVKKIVQEIYSIINYGELYKKLGNIMDKSFGVKLAEMIYRGSTVIKYKGRTLRVKTPMCRALRKLNQLEDNYEELKLPNRVTVEIRPREMAAFYHVQSMAQNPRLKTALPLQKRLSCVLACLNKRWKTEDAKNFERAVMSTNPITDPLVPNKDDILENKKVLMPALRLSPPEDAKIELPSINLSEYLTRQTICLTAFEARLGLDTYSELKLKKKSLKAKADAEQKYDSNCDKDSSSKEDNEINSSNEADPNDNQLSGVNDSAVNTILSLQKMERQDSEQSESEDIQPNSTVGKEGGKDVKKELREEPVVLDSESLEKIDRIKKGWTDADCHSLTIGELYLMYGADSKLVLEYSWDSEDEVKKEKKINTAHFLERWSDFYDGYADEHSHLRHSLAKLLSLAKLSYRRNIVKCACGHICSDKPTSHNQRHLNLASTSTPKIQKLPDNFYAINETSVHLDDLKEENVSLDGDLINFSRAPMYIQPKPQPLPVPTMEQQLHSWQKLNPKYTNRKGRRPRAKQVVVERKLPLLPNNIESGHQIVRMNIISQKPPTPPPALEKVVGQLEDDPPLEEDTDEAQSTVIAGDASKQVERDNASPPLNSATTTSPSRILKEGEWMNTDVSDYSLSSLLGHLESPVKMPSVSSMAADLSTQVDAHLQSLLTQSSMDFAASFAELARVTCELPSDNCVRETKGE